MKHRIHLHVFLCLILMVLLRPAVPTLAGSGPAFEARIDFDVGVGPCSLAVADLNEDGHLDAVVANKGFDSLSILLGTGDGLFLTETRVTVGNGPAAVTAVDLDGDDHLELVVINEYDDNIEVLPGNGDGSFQTGLIFSAGNGPSSLAVGDLNGDGYLDLVVTVYFFGELVVLLGNGDCTFQEGQFVAAGDNPSSVVAADLDGDSNLDLAVTDHSGNVVLILKGAGDGTFGSPDGFPVGDGPRSITVEDVDHDLFPDLLMANDTSNEVSVLLGNGDGTFQPTLDYHVDQTPMAVAVGDLNGDGHPDLATVNEEDKTVSVLLGDGEGFFQPTVLYQPRCGNLDIIMADLNEDGGLDLVTANDDNNDVSVLLGNGDGTFQIAVKYDVGVLYEEPLSVAMGDLNGDGDLDLVTANGGNTISVFHNNGDGTLGTPVPYQTGARPSSVAMADLNMDGYADLAVSNANSDDICILLGDGDGTFQTAVFFGTGARPVSVAVGRLDGDAIPDLAVANDGSHDVSVLLGEGDGTFRPAVMYGTGYSPQSVALGDLDSDGDLDLVTGNDTSSSGDVSVLPGNGDGSFQAAVHYEAGSHIESVALDDLDGDGDLDLATDAVSVLLGNGDGTFQAAQSYSAGYLPKSVVIAELNGDQYPDLAVAVYGHHQVAVFPGNGDGTFQMAIKYGGGDHPIFAAAGDLNGDLAQDLVTVSSAEDYVSVLLNQGFVRPLIVTGPGPAFDNPPQVRVFPAEEGASHLYQFDPYGADHFGVNVTCGQMAGDDLTEIITGAGQGEIYGPHVRGFQMDGTPLAGLNFLAYGTNKYGVNVAAGNLDSDGYDEIVTGAGPGTVFGPHVRAFDYDGAPGVTPVPGVNFFAYGTPRWGVNVAAGDIDGDGFDEIVTGPGPGPIYGPHVRGWDVDDGTAAAMTAVSFLAYGTNRMGVRVACGDLDNDGIDEIVTTPGPSSYFASHVRGWNYDGAQLEELPGCSFFAWPADQALYGANVFAGADLNGDGRDDLVVGAGPDPAMGSAIKVFLYDGNQVTEWFSLEAFPGLSQGAGVAAGYSGLFPD